MIKGSTKLRFCRRILKHSSSCCVAANSASFTDKHQHLSKSWSSERILEIGLLNKYLLASGMQCGSASYFVNQDSASSHRARNS